MTPPDLDPSAVRTIDDVIADLDRVVDWSLDQPSRLGYFAALYRKVTLKVKEGIEEGFFDDGPRMERLDVIFAKRYLVALDRFLRDETPTAPWGVAFDAAGRWRPLILQQLLVGINAHINLDLGVAAAQVAPDGALLGFRRDFERINEILASMTGQAQQALAQISPWLGLLDVVSGRADDEVVRFSIEVARHEAWRFAVELAALAEAERAGPIAARDRFAARLGRRVRRPGMLTTALWLIRLRESKDVQRNLDVLTAIPGPDLTEVETRVQDGPPTR